jgi:iron complex outermembrane receptor protein
MLSENRMGRTILIGFLFSTGTVYAQQRKTKDSVFTNILKEVTIQGDTRSGYGSMQKISRSELQLIQSATLGETLSHLPGIQNTYFGPHSGAPMIRSLSGNRVKILSNGIAMNDLSGISPNLNVLVDMENLLGIEVFKSDASVLYGGKAIGGAINLKDNSIPRKREGKTLAGSVVVESGKNARLKQAFDLNGDIGKKWEWHLGGMFRSNKDLSIPGNTKAPIAYDPAIDDLTQTMAQVTVRKEIVRNLTLYPYLSQFVVDNLNNPEWGLTEADLYTFQATSTIGGIIVPNPRNTLFVPGQPAGTPLATTTVKGVDDYAPVVKGVMPNSHSNDYMINAGTSYITENFYAGLGIRRSYGYYGIPGFALRKLPGHTHTHDDGYTHEVEGSSTYLPIQTRSAANSVSLESEYRMKTQAVKAIRLNYTAQDSKDSELIGSYLANQFISLRHAARLEVEQQVFPFWRGTTGTDFSHLKMSGKGEQRYIPDNTGLESGIFTLQQLNLKPLTINLGYRHDEVNRKAMLSEGYRPSRGLGGGKLRPRNFHLDQFSAGMRFDIKDYAFVKASYQYAERAPEVNELYAGNNHFALMIEENGDDRLHEEMAKTIEFGAGVIMGELQLSLTHYKTLFDQYLYLAHTGISRSGGFLVKEWRQADTEINGWEAELAYRHMVKQNINLKLNAYFDLVKNKNISKDHLRDWAEGAYMPNMPTSRYGFSGGLVVHNWEYTLWADRYLSQRYLGKNINPEPPMPAYMLLSSNLSYSGHIGRHHINYYVNGQNLLNKEARPQNSFLKYLAPLPGLNINLGIRMNI